MNVIRNDNEYQHDEAKKLCQKIDLCVKNCNSHNTHTPFFCKSLIKVGVGYGCFLCKSVFVKIIHIFIINFLQKNVNVNTKYR